MPRVSVGLPVYNRERLLRISIESILNQTFRDFELIITDNASTDGTPKICEEYAKSDERVRYHRNPQNIGAPRNFNLAFQLSKGEYLKWNTSDDYVAPDMIEKCVDVLDRHPDVVLCYPNAKLVDGEGKLLSYYDDVLDLQEDRASRRFIRLLSTIRLAHQHLGVIRCDALRRTALHQSFMAADINFLAELSLYGKFYQVPEYLLFRRMHPGSSSWERANRSAQIAWSDPQRKERIRLDRWESMSTFFSAVWRCPAPLRDKLEMSNHLLHQMYWARSDLGSELKWAIGAKTRHIFHRHSRLA